MSALAFGLVILSAAGLAVADQAQGTREALVAEAERAPGPAQGRDDAPITIVEFSDFQCSFCRKFSKETLPRIEAEYVKTGKARLVYRHLAVLGPFSERAAEAAACAGDQGKFWAYHDRLFERAGRLGLTEPQLMEDLRMDRIAMEACLASGRHADRVRRESDLARKLGARGTPTFLINGQLLIGAHPFATFKRILDGLGPGHSDSAIRPPAAAPRQ